MEKAPEIMKDVCNKIEENLKKKITLITLNHREQNNGCETKFPLSWAIIEIFAANATPSIGVKHPFDFLTPSCFL